MLADVLAQPLDQGDGVGELRRGDQPEVPRGSYQVVATRDDAHHWQPDALQRAADLGGVPRAASPVEDHATDPYGRVEAREPGGDGGDRPAGAADVQYQHDRGLGQACDVRGGGEPVGAQTPVEQAHHTLHDGDVGTACAVQQQGHDAFLADQMGVEVPSGTPGGQRVETRVDVVGADLVAAHGQPGVTQRRHQAGRDGRFARSGRRRGQHEAGHVGHHQPAAVIGELWFHWW